MLSSVIRTNVTRTTLYRFYVSLAGNNYTSALNQRHSKDSVLQCITSKHNVIPQRHIMYENNNTVKYLPLLPGYICRRTSIFQNISVLFTSKYLRSSIDPDFYLKSVVQCIAKVVQKVSEELVNQNYESLEGLVDDDALKLLKERIDSLSDAERNIIAIKENEMIGCIPSSINIENLSQDQSSSSATARVEMNAVIYYRPQCAQATDVNVPSFPVILAANYLFVRDYIPNESTDWTIKYINYARKCIYSGY